MNIKTVDNYFSQFIRLRDTNENGIGNCCSCGKIVKYNNSDCGHYVNRKHNSLRYSEINCNIQCISCNRYSEGNMSGYTLFLIRKYGSDIIEKLDFAKKQYFKLGSFELNNIGNYYKQKVNDLIKTKNFTIK